MVDAEQDMSVVGEADDGREGIRLALELKPDILLLDISMPGVNGLVCAATVKRRLRGIKILMLTRHSDTAYLQELFQAGISGYILKQSNSFEMIRAIRVLAAGGEYIDPAVSRSIIAMLSTNRPRNQIAAAEETLSERESEVLRRIALGYSNKEIADQLGTSTKTIEYQKKSALRRLKITGRTDIVDYAVLRGWLKED